MRLCLLCANVLTFAAFPLRSQGEIAVEGSNNGEADNNRIEAEELADEKTSVIPANSGVSMAELESDYENLWQHEFNRIDDRHKPCFQSVYKQPCADAVASNDTGKYPGGRHCPSNYCCTRRALRGFQAKVCVTQRSSCSSRYFYYREYSNGSCSCASFGDKCGTNSTCKDTPFGPYCKCLGMAYSVDGKCVFPPTTTTTPKPTTTASTATETTTTTTEDVRPICLTQDCRPGFCDVVRGKVICTCLGGYVSKQKTKIREHCVLPQ